LKKKRRKKTERQKLMKRCDELVKEYVRLRDKNICQKCGKFVTGVNCHCSHVIPVSRDRRLAYEPVNLKCLCFHCHINWWHKHVLESGQWYRERFPKRWAYLESQHRINMGLGTIPLDWYRERVRCLAKDIKELKCER
jgi:5-methylcytosine-specific restriction protein A